MRNIIPILFLAGATACSSPGISATDQAIIDQAHADGAAAARERAELAAQRALLQSVMTQEQVEEARVRYSLLENTIGEYEAKGLDPSNLRVEMDSIVAQVETSFESADKLGLRMGAVENRLTVVEDGVLINRTSIDKMQRAAAEALEVFYLERRQRELEESGEGVSG